MLKFKWETEFKKTEIGEIPKDWEVKKIKDFAKVKGGKRLPKGDFLTPISNSHPYIRVVDITDGKITGNNILYVPEDIYPQIKNYVVHTDDLIISIVGTIGVIAYVEKQFDGANLTENAAKITEIKKANPKFIMYYLKSPLGQQEIESNTVGSTQPKLPLYGVQNIRVPFPSLEEQSRIATVLSWFDDLIENKKKQNEILEKTAMAIFKSWFVDFEPFQNEEFVYNEELDREIPKGWKVDFTTKIIDYNPSIRLEKGKVYPFVEMGQVHTDSAVCEFSFKKFKGSGVKYYGGDTLLARITPSLENGKTAFVWFISEKEKGFGTTEFFVLHPKKPWLKEFTYLLAKNEEFRNIAINSMSGTSGRQRADVNALKNYLIPIPPQPILQKFHSLVEPLFQKIILNQKQIMVLRKTRDALLLQLVFGKLRVVEL